MTAVITFGCALRITERPFMYFSKLDWDYIWNGFWCVIILITTGYFNIVNDLKLKYNKLDMEIFIHEHILDDFGRQF